MGEMGRKAMVCIASAALAALGCFSPSPLGENVCRRCSSSCPSGLVCSDGRCLVPCELGCAAGTQCVDAVCVRASGEPMCPEAAVTWNLCVGRAVESPLSQTLGIAREGWLVLESHLP